MAILGLVLADWKEESADLDRLVEGLVPEGWVLLTPAPDWTIAHQIAHLVWGDEAAIACATDLDKFARLLSDNLAAPETHVDETAAAGAARPPAELLAHWRVSREALRKVLSELPAGTRLPWFGPAMSVVSLATARLMETWAHGQDIADALGVRREPTDRLRHIARLGILARTYAFSVHGRTPPQEEFRVELVAPDGSLWTYGPDDAEQRVTGPALDFALLVTQRRHRADLAVQAEGPDADAWLDIAQSFAGPAGKGRSPGQFS